MTEFAQNAEITEKRFAEERKAKSLFVTEDNNESSCFYLLSSHALSSTHRSTSSILIFKTFFEDLKNATFVRLIHITTKSISTKSLSTKSLSTKSAAMTETVMSSTEIISLTKIIFLTKTISFVTYKTTFLVTNKIKQKKTTDTIHECQACRMKFTSRNRLFLHLKKTQHYLKTDKSLKNQSIVVRMQLVKKLNCERLC
jgi:hypothetical protein